MTKSIVYFAAAAILMGTSAISLAQKIRTIAGNGAAGYSGDGSKAIYANIGKAQGIATDLAGNVFISDNDANIVRKITPGGIISTYAGTGFSGYSGDGGAATAAMLNYPTGLATDQYGNLYVGGNGNFSIRKIDTAGVITTVVGDGTHTWGFAGDGGPAVAAKLNGCVALAFDIYGNMYIADGNTRVRKVDWGGTITTFAGNNEFGYSGDGGAATDAVLANPYGVAADASGNIYISDLSNNVIRKVNTSGIISNFAGSNVSGYSGDGGAASSAKINNPAGLVIDTAGNIYFADQANNCIRKIQPSGIITTVAGTGTPGYSGDGGLAIDAAIQSDNAIGIDNAGNLFIADMMNYVVREVINYSIFNISSSTGTNAAQGTPVTFTAPSSLGDYGMSFQWVLNGANVGINNNEYVNSELNNGDVVSCMLVDGNSGIGIDTSNAIVMNIPNLFTPGYISQQGNVHISLTPNPNNGSFNISGNLTSATNEPICIRIYDMLGRLQYQNQLTGQNGQVKTRLNLDEAVPAGKYIMTLGTNEITTTTSFEIIK